MEDKDQLKDEGLLGDKELPYAEGLLEDEFVLES